MSQKYCPRCGSLYTSLKSSTCPQCFAILDEIDDATAKTIIEAKNEQEQATDYLEAKKSSDEEFRHKSFQACIGCAGIIILTLIVSVIIIWKAVSVNTAHLSSKTSNAINAPSLVKTTGTVKNELSEEITGFQKKTDEQVGLLSGTLSKINHAEYGKPNSIETIDVYYIPAECQTTDRNQFTDAVRLLAYLGKDKPKPYVIVESASNLYAIISSGNDNVAKVSVENFGESLTGIVKGKIAVNDIRNRRSK